MKRRVRTEGEFLSLQLDFAEEREQDSTEWTIHFPGPLPVGQPPIASQSRMTYRTGIENSSELGTTIMKNKTLVLAFLSAAGLMVGCDKPQSASQQMDDVQEKTAAAAQDLDERDYTYAQKSEYTAQMESRLAEINRDLDRLEAKIEKSSDAAKAEAKPKLQALRDQSAKLKTKLGEARSATESNWDSVKAGTKEAYNDLKDGFTQARQWVSEKIAP